jgi:hypothetical protein
MTLYYLRERARTGPLPDTLYHYNPNFYPKTFTLPFRTNGTAGFTVFKFLGRK